MWSKYHIKACLGIELRSENTYQAVVIDSRKVQKDDIFIGIKGPNYDGNDFTQKALDTGAGLCLVTKTELSTDDSRVVFLNDPYVDGLLALARYARDERYTNSIFIGVTGSVGKTTTKEMLYMVFKTITQNTYPSYGNQNNEYGLPLSLVNIDREDLECGIFELGMSAPGEMSFLTSILKPNIAVITGIAPAHMASFNHLSEIAAAKAEIITSIQENGILVVNFDSPHLDVILDIASQRPDVRTFGYSIKPITHDIHCKVVLQGTETPSTDSLMTRVSILVDCEKQSYNYTYDIGCIGDDYVVNSMAVAACILSYCSLNGVESTEHLNAIKALSTFHGVAGRGKITHLKNLTLIDESYNANPTSMRSAIRKLAQNSQILKANRTVAILGDMLELGVNEIEMHEDLVIDIENNNISRIICVGDRMASLSRKLANAIHFKSAKDLIPELSKHLSEGDIVLVKASNGIGLSEVCGAIQNLESLSI